MPLDPGITVKLNVTQWGEYTPDGIRADLANCIAHQICPLEWNEDLDRMVKASPSPDVLRAGAYYADALLAQGQVSTNSMMRFLDLSEFANLHSAMSFEVLCGPNEPGNQVLICYAKGGPVSYQIRRLKYVNDDMKAFKTITDVVKDLRGSE